MKINLKQSGITREFIAFASFESNPTDTRRSIAINLEELKQELDSLFNTRQYERPYLPEYYNPLEEVLGELWSEQTKAIAYHLIVDKIGRFIPRITVDSKTTFSYDNYKITMNLVFYYTNDFSKNLYNYTKEFDIET